MSISDLPFGLVGKCGIGPYTEYDYKNIRYYILSFMIFSTDRMRIRILAINILKCNPKENNNSVMTAMILDFFNSFGGIPVDKILKTKRQSHVTFHFPVTFCPA